MIHTAWKDVLDFYKGNKDGGCEAYNALVSLDEETPGGDPAARAAADAIRDDDDMTAEVCEKAARAAKAAG